MWGWRRRVHKVSDVVDLHGDRPFRLVLILGGFDPFGHGQVQLHKYGQ